MRPWKHQVICLESAPGKPCRKEIDNHNHD